jgi:hypothetical protein
MINAAAAREDLQTGNGAAGVSEYSLRTESLTPEIREETN